VPSLALLRTGAGSDLGHKARLRSQAARLGVDEAVTDAWLVARRASAHEADVNDDDPVGKRVRATVRRIGGPGAYLSIGGGEDVVLLPRREAPASMQVGDVIEVFVYLDSEDTPVATSRSPRIVIGEVAFLEVVSLERYGAFVDWGLPKDLLVPHDETTHDLAVGDRVPIGLYLDQTRRLVGTMRVTEMLRGAPPVRLGDWVEGEAWRKEPEIGIWVIVERRSVGLLPAHEPNDLSRGERARFRVAHVHPDGKIELSLRALAHEERDRDAARILEVLARRPGERFGDRSSPEEIREAFGLSKKAFKRALGGLLRRGDVMIDDDGSARPTKPLARR
jgi:predicted RNA-binding protein (virulence factor B family)